MCVFCGYNAATCNIDWNGVMRVTSCSVNYILSGNQCIFNGCPQNQYFCDPGCLPCTSGQFSPANNRLRQCQSCGVNALSCAGSAITACILGYTLWNGQCQLLPSSCPANQFICDTGHCANCPAGSATPFNNKLRRCQPCGAHIASCAISTWGVVVITTCERSYTLYNGQCVYIPSSCTANTFIPGSNCDRSPLGQSWQELKFRSNFAFCKSVTCNEI